MKRIAVKRIIYTDSQGKEYFDSREFDGQLSDCNILGFVHEVGKTKWHGGCLWTLKDGKRQYRIHVERFWHYEKAWYDHPLDWFLRLIKWR